MKNLFKKIPILTMMVLISSLNCYSAQAADDKNIVPILDLKGGVRQEQATPKPTKLKGWLDGNYATGDWLGARAKLEEKGIYLNSTYTIDAVTKTRGGTDNKRATQGMYYGNTSIQLDTEKLGLWKDGTINANMQYLTGMPLGNVGDIQGYNSNGSSRYVMLHEAWIKQALFKGKVEIKGGKQNANAEFIGLPATANFMNLSFGVMGNSKMPNSPNTALGIATKYSPVKSIDLRYGLFDGDARPGRSGMTTAFDKKGGSYNIAEITFKPEIKGHEGQYKLGGWYHTANATEITDSDTPKTHGGNQGLYIALQQNVYHEKNDKSQGLDIIGQFGGAPENRNQIGQYYGAGVRYKGLIPKRNADELGIATAIANFSSRSETLYGQNKESVIEVYNKIQLTPWIAVQPDLQVIIHPGGNQKSTTLFGLKTFISF